MGRAQVLSGNGGYRAEAIERIFAAHYNTVSICMWSMIMSETVSKLLPILETLSDDECAEVLGFLMGRLPPEVDDMSDEEFVAELDRRVRDIDEGKTQLIDADKYFEELRRKYP
jgi:putative addiction module component (TIGR02574 family)